MYITSTGMVCSVGLNAEAACAAMRAGIDNFVELPYHDNNGEPIVGAMVPEIELDLKREERLVDLLKMPVAECLQKGKIYSDRRIPIFVGLANTDRPGAAGSLADGIIPRLEEKLDIHFNREFSRVIPKGHTSGFEALKFASQLFQKTDAEICLVCGVDSYINASALNWLDEHWRLKTEDNSDGVIPGEAAAAVLLQKQVNTNGQPEVKIIGLGFGHEEASVLTEEPLLGVGLTEAARSALEDAGLEMHEIDFRISDVTGESYGFKELSLVEARLLRERKESFPLWHCAESIGDTGAAAGICELIYAYQAFLKGYSPGKRAICFTSSVSEERAVGVIEEVLN